MAAVSRALPRSSKTKPSAADAQNEATAVDSGGLDEIESVSPQSVAVRWTEGVHEFYVLLAYGAGAVVLSAATSEMSILLFGFGLVLTFIGACGAYEWWQGQPHNPVWARFAACFTMPLTVTSMLRFTNGRHPVMAVSTIASLMVSIFIVLKVGWPFAMRAKKDVDVVDDKKKV